MARFSRTHLLARPNLWAGRMVPRGNPEARKTKKGEGPVRKPLTIRRLISGAGRIST
jgi:hypothetical protein